MTNKQLKTTLEKHKKWLLKQKGGERANLSNANLSNANLSYANLSYANLYNANLYNANLYNADLSNANLSNANLSYANLSYANLYNANLYNANLYNADLSNANLSNASLSYAYLSKADLSDANLSNADLSNANLYNANLSEANLFNSVGLLFVQLKPFPMYIQEHFVRIGCMDNSIKEWLYLSKKDAEKLGLPKQYYDTYRTVLKTLHKAYFTKTAHKESCHKETLLSRIVKVIIS